jgi:hypothetical protein
MAWKIKANYLEACNCDLGCPCNMSGFPTTGACEGSIAVHINEGERDGVDLKGAKFIGAVKWPGAIHEGNGVMAVFIDGNPDQQAALVEILTGNDPGLPFEILATTISEIKGPYFEPIAMTINDTESHAKVGKKLEMKLQSFKNPVSGDNHEVHMVLPTGFIWQDGKVCTTSANMVDVDGVQYDHKGKNAYYSEIEWSSENRVDVSTSAGKFAD